MNKKERETLFAIVAVVRDEKRREEKRRRGWG